MASQDTLLHPGLLLAMTYADLQADHATNIHAKGQFGLVRDDYGIRIMRYMHCMLASSLNASKGGLYSRAANVTPTQAAGSTTTHLTFNAASFTANALVGRIAHVVTNGGSAGVAPEGESGVITANGTATLELDSSMPLSAAPSATGDTIIVYSLFDFIKSAGGDLNHNVFGIAVATNGITNGNWGVLQQYGYCPNAKCKSNAAVTVAKALIADTEQVTVSSTSADNLLIGFAPVTGNSTNRGQILVFINTFAPMALTA
jgi:hypothetical protein